MDDIVWTYKNDDWIRQSDLIGYGVEARDGSIGTIDEASTEAARRWLVVDTGFWIFGKKRLIPGRRHLVGRARRQEGPRRHDEGPDQKRA